MREPPRITEEQLRTCLQDQYDLGLVTLEFLPLGHDYDAAVYHAMSKQGTAYLLKVTSRPLYEARCLIPRYLNDQGIASVVAPLRTRSGALWTVLSEWTVIVYPWISGDSSLIGMTDEQWKQVGTIFKQIHQVMLPPVGFESLRKETFDPTEYIRWVRTFETQQVHTEAGSSRDEREPADLSTGWSRLQEKGGQEPLDYFDKWDRQAVQKRLVRRLEKLGYEVTLTPTGSAA